MNDVKKVRTVLVRALALIKRGWTRGVDARDKNGYAIDCKAERACAWCARGAIYAAGGDSIVLTAFENYGIPRNLRGTAITSFNDTRRDKRPILAAFRRVIKSCK